METGKYISMISHDGLLNAGMEINLTHWGGIAYLVDREKILSYKDNPKMKQAGVYILYGETTEKNGVTTKRIFIGHATKSEHGVLAGIINHDKKNQNYWNKVFVFIDKNANDLLEESQLVFIEDQLTGLIKLAKEESYRYFVESKCDSINMSFSDDIKCRLKPYIDGIVYIVNALNFDIFKKERTNGPCPQTGKKQKPNKPIRHTISPEHPIRTTQQGLTFSDYLHHTMKNTNTADCYAGNITRLNTWLRNNHYFACEDCNLENMDADQAIAFCEDLLKDDKFQRWNKEKHYNFSAAIRIFVEYKKTFFKSLEGLTESNFPKIGKIAKKVIIPLLSEGFFTNEDIDFMLSEESGKQFKTDSSKPLLILAKNRNLVYDSKGHARYSPHQVMANGRRVCIYTQLRAKGLNAIIQFLNSRGISNDDIIMRCK